ncbi:MAG TPA: cupin domain-containing protein [Candidatus Sulfotelmatobacter sp.]|nr:cupin domain-containing protein [Candidatus Sulfotelmatobacter sp.]
MDPKIVKASTLKEIETSENCSIMETWSSDKVSIARARVKPGLTTEAHYLKNVDEIYIIVKGKGSVKAGDLEVATVIAGDTVFIPAGVWQQITNVGKTDLVFYCVCTPRFTQESYHSGH